MAKIDIKKIRETEKLERMTFDIPMSLKRALKLKAVDEGRKIKSILCMLISAYIDGKIKLSRD
jgi:hypothetical protein